MLAIFFAILMAVVWAVMNVFDKYIVTHKVKNPLSYAVVAGIANIIIGTIIAAFVSWQITQTQFFFAALAGVLVGLQFYFYFLLLKKEDVSALLGFVYIYPILVLAGAYFVLGERISLLGYFGIAIILAGVLVLSLRMQKIKWQMSLWMLAMFIVLIALYELFLKVAAEIPLWNGLSITMMFLGLTILPAMLHPKTRKHFSSELKNLPWAFASEIITTTAVLCSYLAMEHLPVSVVSTVGAIQPLCVLIFERLVETRVNISRDNVLLPKLGAIVLIVVGVVLLSIA